MDVLVKLINFLLPPTLITALFYFYYSYRELHTHKMNSSFLMAEATIINKLVVPYLSRVGTRGNAFPCLEYSFNDAVGEKHVKRIIMQHYIPDWDDITVGQQLMIKYNPADPSVSYPASYIEILQLEDRVSSGDKGLYFGIWLFLVVTFAVGPYVKQRWL